MPRQVQKLNRPQLLDVFLYYTTVMCVVAYGITFLFPIGFIKYYVLCYALLNVTLILLRKFYGWYLALANVYILSLYLIVLQIVRLTGGPHSAMFFWFMLLPVIAFLLQSLKSGLSWMTLVVITILIFYFFNDTILIYDTIGSIRWKVISSLLLIPFIFYLIYVFSVKLEERKEAIESQNEMLLNQSVALNEMNEEIKSQYELISEQNTELEENKQEVLTMNEKLERQYNEAISRNDRMDKFWKILMSISQNKEMQEGEVDRFIPKVLKIVSETLKIDQVSLWEMENLDQAQRLVLKNAYALNQKLILDENLTVNSWQYPLYFEEINRNQVIVASDAFRHEATECLHDYLIEHKVFSLLDVPIFHEGKLHSLICCEHKSPRVWLPEEVIFVKSITDIVSISYKAEQRKNFQKKLLQRQNQINQLNATLEKKVEERTSVLAIQNKQLMDYAFMNSHIIRGPLCRVMGLRNLMTMTNDPDELRTYNKLLQQSIDEMDEVIKKSSELLEKGISSQSLLDTLNNN